MKTAVVICPGRGTYNKAELGYLQRTFPDAALLENFEQERRAMNQSSLAELDGAARFSPKIHTRGDNASALIFSTTLGDFLSIDQDAFEIVAVTGNSLGWYSTLACGGAVSVPDGFRIANTMGTLMQNALIGGQLIYPFTDDNWRPDQARRASLMAHVEEIGQRKGHILALSIALGGMLVLAGNEAGLSAFEQSVDVVQERFPMRLPNHAAFHTDLMAPVAEEGRQTLPAELFQQPNIPMIDGRGAIWWPKACNLDALWDYTLRAQVTQTYDFTKAVQIAAREFSPDVFIITGPGTTLGGATAQSLIQTQWRGLDDKANFQAMQASPNPLLLSMGMPDQRTLVIGDERK